VVWSSDGSKLIFVSADTSISSIAITGNGSPTTLMKVPSNAKVSLLSPDGKYALLHATNNFEVWDVNGGKQISTISPTGNPSKLSTWAFSPDGSLLAFGKSSGQTQIYTTADGKQQSSFSSVKTDPAFLGIALAWSPDGKYLAEGTNAVSIYDVNAKKAVETLGQGDAQHQVVGMAWSPDSKELISSVATTGKSAQSDVTLSVWALS
jgi:WD40 repeat protein